MEFSPKNVIVLIVNTDIGSKIAILGNIFRLSSTLLKTEGLNVKSEMITTQYKRFSIALYVFQISTF